MEHGSKQRNMSRWFGNIQHGAAAVVVALACSTSMQGQDALSCLIPARWATGQAISAPSSQGFQRSLVPKLTVDLSHRNIDLGLVNTPFQTSRLHVNYAIPERSGNGEVGWMGQIEDDREGESLQRLRIVAGAYKKVKLDRNRYFSAALQLGYGRRAWRNSGLWDSQFLQNPVAPELAESGESSAIGATNYLETGIELGFQSLQFTAVYRALHAPVDQGFFRYTEDPYALRHTVMLSRHQEILGASFPMRNLSWLEMERQAGAQLLSLGTMFTVSVGEDSQFTDLKSATRIGLGAVYRSTGQIAPVLSCQFERRWTCWVAPEMAVGINSIRSGWNAGMRVQLN